MANPSQSFTTNIPIGEGVDDSGAEETLGERNSGRFSVTELNRALALKGPSHDFKTLFAEHANFSI